MFLLDWRGGEVKEFSVEALVIVGLMRKLGVEKVDVSELDFSEPKGLVIGSDEVVLEERDGGKL